MEKKLNYFNFKEEQKKVLKSITSLAPEEFDKLKELFFSELKEINPSKISGKEKFVNVLIEKLNFKVENSIDVVRSCTLILDLSHTYGFDDVKKFLEYNEFKEDDINRIVDFFQNLLSAKIVELFNTDREAEVLEHKILPHINDIKWVIDHRLNKTNESYEFIPVVIGTFELHEPSHKDKKSDLYFQLTPDLLDSFIEDLMNIKEELNKQKTYLKKYSDEK